MSDSVITHAPGVFAVGHLGELTQVVPFDLVDGALASAGGLQQRVRRLPSRVVVHLLLAGALFTGAGWTGIWSRLTALLSVPLPVPPLCQPWVRRPALSGWPERARQESHPL
ncbi:transposase domain-containing protein [Streptomyces sp. NPDC059818]|uniref:transposase domain-containing protein n=1 Tax=Streptomyces sp. NPDC059818 TaxID=3346962 RepID=UPI0036672421